MPETHKAALLPLIQNHEATVCVVGLGYVGLPLAIAIAAAGNQVLGLDLSQRIVDAVNSGRSHIEGIDEVELERVVATGKLVASTHFDDITAAQVAVIAVPTPIDEYRLPDLSYVRAAIGELAPRLKPGSLVILESTTYPGTTEEVILPELRSRGLVPGRDVFVGYSPERIDPGNEKWQLSNTPKVVSGYSNDCVELVIAFYSQFVQNLVPVSNLRTAEITKLFENIFRCVNIALVNEFQQICDGFGIDVWEVIQACSTKPYGFMPFYPGPGLGGHCVPVDPFYLAWKAREKRVSTEFIELAGRVNASMPLYVIGKVNALLNSRQRSLNGARVALLGVAYKKNSSDVRESPAIRIIELLQDRGAVVSYHDPYVPMLESPALQSNPLSAEFLAAQDCAIVTTDHDAIDWGLVLQFSPIVLDTRNALGRLSPGGARLSGGLVLDQFNDPLAGEVL
ncbi:MAG TPA: nucleotide sugar dehydrogenase [Candidatus Dormibacteraeota bacterium]